MGERIRDCGTLRFRNHELIVEMNAPIDEYTGATIHLQGDDLRIELPQTEFFRLAGACNLARRQLRIMKGQTHEDD